MCVLEIASRQRIGEGIRWISLYDAPSKIYVCVPRVTVVLFNCCDCLGGGTGVPRLEKDSCLVCILVGGNSNHVVLSL